MVVATPSGITLSPEGGAHQSVSTPLIGMGQDKLASFEPAYVDELAAIMRWGFEHMQADDGGSVYLRLSTRALEQASRDFDAISNDVIEGAYWMVPPGPGSPLAIIYSGAVAPEAIAAHQEILEDIPGAGLLAVTSADRLHHSWRKATTEDGPAQSHAQKLMSALAPGAALVTVMDASPSTLSWLGSVAGHKTYALGIDRFGQSGDIDDLYREYRLDTEAIVDACARACFESRGLRIVA